MWVILPCCVGLVPMGTEVGLGCGMAQHAPVGRRALRRDGQNTEAPWLPWSARNGLGQKRPKLPRLPAAKSTTEQRVKFVPGRDIRVARESL
jgi:hypothetical protein